MNFGNSFEDLVSLAIQIKIGIFFFYPLDLILRFADQADIMSVNYGEMCGKSENIGAGAYCATNFTYT